jgi:hypothetical protein
MTKGTRCSKGRAVAAIASLAALLAVLGLRVELKGRQARRASDAQTEESQSAAKLAALSEFDETHLRALSESVDRFRHSLGADSSLAKALGHLAGQWINEGEVTTEHGAYSTKVHRIRMTAPSVAEWPRIVDTVAFLEGCPGVQVDGIEMKSSGGAAQRSLDYVGMKLVVQVGTGGRQILSR